ncbi:MAG: hypothetical protein M3305_12005 [Actinomycetota bacterium]|nr:hypothetical protein [Actinomycetota bacterium]
MAHLAKTDGLRLLRCINDTQAHGREGAKVDPPRAAQEIGLNVGSERYHDALGYLAEEGALVGDEHTEMHTDAVEGPQPRAYAIYLFTERAVYLLEEHEDWQTTIDQDDPNAYPEAY